MGEPSKVRKEANLHKPTSVLAEARVHQRFGRHVVGGADLLVAPDVGRVVRDRLRDAKVDELDLALDEDEVGRLEIRVDNVLVVDDLDGLEHLREEDGMSIPKKRGKERAHLFPDVADKVHAGPLGRLFLKKGCQVDLAELQDLR